MQGGASAHTPTTRTFGRPHQPTGQCGVVDEMVLVTEHDLNHFMWLLQETEGIVAELGCVAGLATLERYPNL